MNVKTSGHPFLAPKTAKTVALNYGLASLKSILLGYNISINDSQLEAAMPIATAEVAAAAEVGDEDELSLEALALMAGQFGLSAESVLLPAEHLLLPEALPAIVAMRPVGAELPHFVMIWNRLGPLYQLMDPRFGRRWLTQEALLGELYNVSLSLSGDDKEQVLKSLNDSLRARLLRFNLEAAKVETLINIAFENPGWYGLAALDAAARMTVGMLGHGHLRRDSEAALLL